MMAVFHLLQSFGYYGFGTLVPSSSWPRASPSCSRWASRR